eukprot:Hpha_TRINITY_DN16194_c4_g1::TRINITY_DN16194_c4_g1_i1::g.7107::m.7107
MGNKLEKELRSHFSTLEPFPATQGPGNFWNLYQGVLRKPAQYEVTVFVFNMELCQQEGKRKGKKYGPGETRPLWEPLAGAVKSVELLKSGRCPHFPTLVDSYVDEEHGAVFFATEPLVLFSDAIRGLCTTEIVVALADCITGLQFMHNAGLSHNNFGFDSIFFSACPRHRCLIAGLQFACTSDNQMCDRLHCSRPFRDPEMGEVAEDQIGVPVAYDQTPTGTRDIVAVARLIRLLVQEVRPPRTRGELPSAYDAQQAVLQWCVAAENEELRAQAQFCLPPLRPTLDDLLRTPLFTHCRLLQVCRVLDAGIQGGASPAAYAALYPQLCGLPYDVVRERLVPCVLTEAFWVAPGAYTLTGRLVAPAPDCPHPAARAAGLVRGLVLADGHEQVLDFAFSLLQSRKREPRMAVLRVSEPLCAGIHPKRLVESVIPEFTLGLWDENADIVQWSIKGVLAAARAVLMDGVAEQEQQAVIQLLSGVVTQELLVCACGGSGQSSRLRSAALIGLAEMLTVDSRITALPSLLHALTSCLLCSDETLVVHALNAVVIAESTIPYRVIALEVIPLLSVVALHPEHRVSEKAAHVIETLLSSLGDGGLSGSGETEEFSAPPLLKGCPTTAPPPPHVDKKKQKQRPTLQGGVSAHHQDGDLEGTQRERTGSIGGGSVFGAEDCDLEWNKGLGVLNAHHLALDVARSAQARRRSPCSSVMEACAKSAGKQAFVPLDADTATAMVESPLPSPRARRRPHLGSVDDFVREESVQMAPPDGEGFHVELIGQGQMQVQEAGQPAPQGDMFAFANTTTTTHEEPVNQTPDLLQFSVATEETVKKPKGKKGRRRKAAESAQATPQQPSMEVAGGGLEFELPSEPPPPAAAAPPPPPPPEVEVEEQSKDEVLSPRRGGRDPTEKKGRRLRKKAGAAAAGDPIATDSIVPAPAPPAGEGPPLEAQISVDDLLDKYDPEHATAKPDPPAPPAPEPAVDPVAEDAAPPAAPAPKKKVTKKKRAKAADPPPAPMAAEAAADVSADWLKDLHLSRAAVDVGAVGGVVPSVGAGQVGEGVGVSSTVLSEDSLLGWVQDLHLSQRP